jgi:DNA-binding NtrC family response regulator
MAKAKLRILYGEGDEEVLKLQGAELEKAGHTVQQVLGRKAAEEALKKSTFDLVVLGASLTRNDRHHLPYMAKKANAEISVLVLHADGTRHPYVDACVDTGASMENILNRIESMKIAGMMPAAKAAAAGAGR